MVALLETKMQDHQVLLDDFPFIRMIDVPAIGNSRGLAILWDDALLELDQISTTDQEIQTMIKVISKKSSWLLSCIYVSTYHWNRKILWQNLKTIKDHYKGKWLVGGDFNEILFCTEKREVILLTKPTLKISGTELIIVNSLIWVPRRVNTPG